MWERYKNFIYSSVISLFGIFYFLFAFKIRKFGDAVLDSQSLPKILGVILITTSLIQTVKTFLEAQRNSNVDKVDKKEDDAPDIKKVIYTLALMIVYAVILKPLGFLISTALFVFLQSLVLESESDTKKNRLVSIIFAVVFSIVIYLIFVRVFSLVLPAGILG